MAIAIVALSSFGFAEQAHATDPCATEKQAWNDAKATADHYGQVFKDKIGLSEYHNSLVIAEAKEVVRWEQELADPNHGSFANRKEWANNAKRHNMLLAQKKENYKLALAEQDRATKNLFLVGQMMRDAKANYEACLNGN